MVKKEVDVFSLKDIPGIGDIGASKLEEAGILSKRDILVFGWIEVAELTGMKREDAEEAVAYCRETLQKAGDQWDTEMDAYQLLKKRETLTRIPTGSKALDDLFDGGIEARAITEFAGPFGSGKTQMAHSLAITTVTSGQDSKPSRVLFIDTEDTCRPERLQQIAESRGLVKKGDEKQLKDILSRVIVQKADDAAHLIMIVENASHIMKELNIKLIILDSGTALYRQTMQEFGDQGRKFRLLNKLVHLLKSMAEIHDVPVIFINQVYQSTDMFNPGEKVYGGNVVAHAMTYRVKLKRKPKVWVATAIDFPNKPVEDVQFLVTDAGITDIKKKEKLRKG